MNPDRRMVRQVQGIGERNPGVQRTCRTTAINNIADKSGLEVEDFAWHSQSHPAPATVNNTLLPGARKLPVDPSRKDMIRISVSRGILARIVGRDKSRTRCGSN